MKALLLSAALGTGLLFTLPTIPYAHGGRYLGPGDTVPPGGGQWGGSPTIPRPGAHAGPSTTPTGPGMGGLQWGPPGSAGGRLGQTGRGGGDVDLTQWSFWWEFNKEPYLDLKSAIHSGNPVTGSDGWWLGEGHKSRARSSLRPTEEQIRGKVVPALLAALENETNNDIVTACLIALARIGEEKSESGTSRLERLIANELSNPVQEIAETAAVALGILASDGLVPTLGALLSDDAAGQALVGGAEVDRRTRSFAAYGLALIGTRTGSEDVRREIVEYLHQILTSDTSRSFDLGAACVIALGLVPLETLQAGAPGARPADSRLAQIEFLLSFFADEKQNAFTRAHVPTAVVRLFRGPAAERPTPWPDELGEAMKVRIAEVLVSALHTSRSNEIQAGSALALGLLGDLDRDPVDTRIRTTLSAASRRASDQQTRFFALIALGRLCNSRGNDDIESGLEDVQRTLLSQLSRGSSTARPWAGLAIGVACEAFASVGLDTPHVVPLREALREALRLESNDQRIGAYAIACGIAGDQEAPGLLLEKLQRMNSDEARGYVAVALGLMNAREAIEPIQKIVRESRYRPDLLKQAAIALGLLGDKEVVGELTSMLEEAQSLAVQAAVASALGIIGDADSIDPLVTLLADTNKTDLARAFAAAALGIVADKESLPWNAKIGIDLNYRASTPTLNAPSGTGILNLL